MEDNKQIIKKYINTPFAYARAQKGLTLLQQNIMVKVVEHLQVYIGKYFKNPVLQGSKEDPKPMMTREDRDKLPPVRIELSELGVASSSYSRVREALKEVLNVQIEKNTFDDEGKPVKRLIQIFSKIDTPVTDKGTQVRMKLGEDDELTDVQVDRTRGYVDIYLNTDMVFEMFDMNLGYVSHPEDIARIGKVDNMPLMYYLVRHKMKNFKLSKVEITPFEIRDYLGLVKRDADGNVTEVKYPRYSMFKSRIIKTALDDIKRVCDAGQIDFYFDIKEVRSRGKKTGEPSYIEFVKVAEKKKEKQGHRKASERRLCKTLCEIYPTLDEKRLMTIFKTVPEDLWTDFKTYAYNGVPKAVEQPHSWNGTMESFVFYIMEQWIKQHSANPEPQQQTFAFAEAEEVKPGEKEWQMYLRLIDKDLASDLGKVRYMLYKKGCVLLGIQNDAQREMIEDHFIDDAVLKHAQECAMKIFGNKISLAYKNIKQ
jgi:hypothetical protein